MDWNNIMNIKFLRLWKIAVKELEAALDEVMMWMVRLSTCTKLKPIEKKSNAEERKSYT